MSGLPGFLMWRSFVRATYTINGRPMTDAERKEFDAKLEEHDRRMREFFKELGTGTNEAR